MNNSEKNVWIFVYDCLATFATSAKFMLLRIFLWRCTNIRACRRLCPIVDLGYVFTRFETEKMLSRSLFVACESKSNLVIFPTSIIKKLLFRDISCNFSIMVPKTIFSLSLRSNKLGNNFNCDTNLLTPMSRCVNFR